MRITVVLSTYERDEFLRLALLSLGRQERLPEELVVVDDGSRRDMAPVISDWARTVPVERVKYVRQEYRGFRLARSRNNGIREAGGEYLVFWDQDILATPGYLRQFSRHGRRGQFLVAFPVLLAEKQTQSMMPELVRTGDFSRVLTRAQLRCVHRQFVKDTLYYYAGKVLGAGRNRPKVRGGCFGITRHDALMVDGFDENYRGWGAEDDDLGRRLYRAGVVGRTVFRDEFPLHLWHEHVTGGADSPNLDYYNRRRVEIARGDYRAVNGLSRPLDGDAPVAVRIK